MNGTEKQITWAEKVKQIFIADTNKFEEIISELKKYEMWNEKREANYIAFKKWVEETLANPDAAYWIENRDKISYWLNDRKILICNTACRTILENKRYGKGEQNER